MRRDHKWIATTRAADGRVQNKTPYIGGRASPGAAATRARSERSAFTLSINSLHDGVVVLLVLVVVLLLFLVVVVAVVEAVLLFHCLTYFFATSLERRKQFGGHHPAKSLAKEPRLPIPHHDRHQIPDAFARRAAANAGHALDARKYVVGTTWLRMATNVGRPLVSST